MLWYGVQISEGWHWLPESPGLTIRGLANGLEAFVWSYVALKCFLSPEPLQGAVRLKVGGPGAWKCTVKPVTGLALSPPRRQRKFS